LASKQRYSCAVAMAAALFAVTGTAVAANRPCSVDVAAPDGERVHYEYSMLEGERLSTLTWTPPSNTENITIRLDYPHFGDSKYNKIWVFSIGGAAWLNSETVSNSASLYVSNMKGEYITLPVFFKKGPAGRSDFGVVIVNQSVSSDWPAGQLLDAEFMSDEPLTLAIKGDGGDVFFSTQINFGSRSQRARLTAEATKLLADELSKGCKLAEEVGIAAPPPPTVSKP